MCDIQSWWTDRQLTTIVLQYTSSNFRTRNLAALMTHAKGVLHLGRIMACLEQPQVHGSESTAFTISHIFKFEIISAQNKDNKSRESEP